MLYCLQAGVSVFLKHFHTVSVDSLPRPECAWCHIVGTRGYGGYGEALRAKASSTEP